MAESATLRFSSLEQFPRDSRTIAQDRLDIAEKVRSNLFPWNGQFSPQLVHALLETYSTPSDLVLDPFMGSGTVLIEAARLGRRAFGSEINPAACKMAQAYAFVNMPRTLRRKSLEYVRYELNRVFGEVPLFSRPEDTGSIRELLLAFLWRENPRSYVAKLLETLIVLVDFYKPALSRRRVLDTWRRLAETVEALPFSTAAIQVCNCDARNLPLPAEVVDLIVTSPPYINVFNYHQQYRASIEALGWDALHVARSEIGSNRKNRGNRFVTVIQYCLDICQALVEMRRVCKRSARIICVVGRESNVLRTPFYNGEIVAKLAVRCAGLEPECRQERVFKNKFGKLIYEEIIHFRPGQLLGTHPAEVAREVLILALSYSPRESRADLQDAISRLSATEASPIYYPSKGREGAIDDFADSASRKT